MAKKTTKLNMQGIAKALGTRVKKSKNLDVGEYIKYNLPTLKGELYSEGSGGLFFKPKNLGLDCYIDHGTILNQIKEWEDKIAAYESLKPDLKRLKKAVLANTAKLPERSKNEIGSTTSRNKVSRGSSKCKKEAATKKD